MTHEFKPGDKVRHREYPDTTYTVFQARHGVWRTKSSPWQVVENFELVEPSVTHRELREVLAELKRPDAYIWNAALEAFFFQLTGERP